MPPWRAPRYARPSSRWTPAIFFRASRKHILNLRFIETIDPWANGGFLAKLKGEFEVELSRREARKVKEAMSPLAAFW
jgi:two-component system LytT family response regulator